MGIKHNPPLVLVADDEIAAATMLKHVFEREGYNVEIANDGVVALEMAQRLKPDLILLDIQMPQMNGFEVLHKLREEPITASIPTIVVSARAREPHEIAMGLNIGADDYISKPFAPQELLARARSKMRARHLEESLQQRTQELEALLRVSEELNRHLKIEELMSLILFLTLDLLPADLVILYQSDKDGFIESYRGQSKHEGNSEEIASIVKQLEGAQHAIHWPGFHDMPIPEYEYGIAIPLEHGSEKLGLLAAMSNTEEYDENQLMLLRGISRQASLALRNAELYEIQANYAQYLEDMVAQRTEELRKTQEMLFRSEKLASIGQLAASIAHEINNPLQPIRLNLEFLLEDAQAGQPVDGEIIQMTQNSVERISRIVSQLLEFTKTNKDTVFNKVNIPQVIQSVIKLNEKTFERANISMATEISNVPEIHANRDQLEQVFMNMLINAKSAMPNGGKMTIRTWESEDTVVIQFIDTGIGIPEDLINKIFDPFVSTKPDGTGLGLFVTYGIIERHQGKIEVKSKVNHGTTFTISLPKT